eukprot:6130166-Alexandrium_andersonii.AAC.1
MARLAWPLVLSETAGTHNKKHTEATQEAKHAQDEAFARLESGTPSLAGDAALTCPALAGS